MIFTPVGTKPPREGNSSHDPLCMYPLNATSCICKLKFIKWICSTSETAIDIFTCVKKTEVKVYPIQHYVIKFVSDLRQVSGFLQEIHFPSPIKTDRHNITEVATNTNTPNPYTGYFAACSFIQRISWPSFTSVYSLSKCGAYSLEANNKGVWQFNWYIVFH
jgi:hypothetical protein